MYILEGNIGAGKSTFLKLVAQHLPQISVALEPLHNWQSKVYGQSLLANFYQDPQRWTYSMETFAMTCRVQEHLKDQENKNPSRIIERSIYSGHYVFALNGYESGYMNDVEWQLYNSFFNFLIPTKCNPPLGFIYLNTDPAIAFTRIKKRNRLAEKKITLSYLKKVHAYHERFLIDKVGLLPEHKEVPVLVLDSNEEFENNPVVLQKHLDAISEFIDMTNQKYGGIVQPHVTPHIQI